MSVAVSPCCASAQQAIDPQAMIRKVESAYAFDASYEVIAEVFSILSASAAPEGQSPGQLRACRGNRLQPVIVTCHPHFGELIDKTDPIQHRSAMGPFGELFTSDAFYSVNPQHRDSVRTVVPSKLAIRGMSALYVPTGIPYLVKWKAESGAGRAEHGADGLIHLRLGDSEFLVEESDSTVVGWSELSPNGVETVVRFVEWQSSPVTPARFPKLGYTKSRVSKDKPYYYTIVEFRAPTLRPELAKKDFEWWTYAPTATDSRTGVVYGPNDVQIATASLVQPPRPSAPPQAFQTDPKSVQANAEDPANPILPMRHNRAVVVLRVLGVVCLLLAMAWAIRKRMS